MLLDVCEMDERDEHEARSDRGGGALRGTGSFSLIVRRPGAGLYLFDRSTDHQHPTQRRATVSCSPGRGEFAASSTSRRRPVLTSLSRFKGRVSITLAAPLFSTTFSCVACLSLNLTLPSSQRGTASSAPKGTRRGKGRESGRGRLCRASIALAIVTVLLLPSSGLLGESVGDQGAATGPPLRLSMIAEGEAFRVVSYVVSQLASSRSGKVEANR